jgi:Bacterial Ig domain/Bacterial Ig-like domain
MKRLVAIACVSLAAAGLFARFSAAAFTGSTAIPSNQVTVDALHNYFSVTPGSAVQPGTSTAVASGSVDSLSLDFGTVPSARTFTSVFTIKNVSGASQTATLTLSNVPQIASIAFASSGGTSATLAAGASTTLTVVTSSTVAGRGTGTLRLGLSGVSWLYRDYSFHVDEAPEAPTAPTVTQKPAGRLDLSWTASTTVTNLAGYDLYRSAGGGAYTKLNSTPLTVTTYSDTATVDGTSYTYKLTAESSGSPLLTSVDSTTVTATADATPPGAPSGIALANGGGAGNAYVNSGNAASLSVSITLPAGSLTTDSVKLTVSNGGSTVITTRAGTAGAGTITVTGLNVAALGDGTLTLSANSTDLAGNVSSTTTVTVTKDTVAPAAPSANYTDNNNAVADQVAGTAEANASITVTETSPTGTQTFTTSANGSGAYSVAVAATNGTHSAPVSVTVSVTARDAAGNTGSATTITPSDQH